MRQIPPEAQKGPSVLRDSGKPWLPLRCVGVTLMHLRLAGDARNPLQTPAATKFAGHLLVLMKATKCKLISSHTPAADDIGETIDNSRKAVNNPANGQTHPWAGELLLGRPCCAGPVDGTRELQALMAFASTALPAALLGIVPVLTTGADGPAAAAAARDACKHPLTCSKQQPTNEYLRGMLSTCNCCLEVTAVHATGKSYQC